MAANRAARPGKTPNRTVPNDTRRWVVCGHRAVGGAKHGELVTETLTVDQADALHAAGHIEPYTEPLHQYEPPSVDLDKAGHDAVAENPTEER